ncbi:MAG: hypothetical protein H0W88_08320 [Parachlamydiaceae bacterium]|nr:hypothetical protein [Parachlamydiaceae bacterium]
MEFIHCRKIDDFNDVLDQLQAVKNINEITYKKVKNRYTLIRSGKTNFFVSLIRWFQNFFSNRREQVILDVFAFIRENAEFAIKKETSVQNLGMRLISKIKPKNQKRVQRVFDDLLLSLKTINTQISQNNTGNQLELDALESRKQEIDRKEVDASQRGNELVAAAQSKADKIKDEVDQALDVMKAKNKKASQDVLDFQLVKSQEVGVKVKAYKIAKEVELNPLNTKLVEIQKKGQDEGLNVEIVCSNGKSLFTNLEYLQQSIPYFQNLNCLQPTKERHLVHKIDFSSNGKGLQISEKSIRYLLFFVKDHQLFKEKTKMMIDNLIKILNTKLVALDPIFKQIADHLNDVEKKFVGVKEKLNAITKEEEFLGHTTVFKESLESMISFLTESKTALDKGESFTFEAIKERYNQIESSENQLIFNKYLDFKINNKLTFVVEDLKESLSKIVINLTTMYVLEDMVNQEFDIAINSEIKKLIDLYEGLIKIAQKKDVLAINIINEIKLEYKKFNNKILGIVTAEHTDLLMVIKENQYLNDFYNTFIKIKGISQEIAKLVENPLNDAVAEGQKSLTVELAKLKAVLTFGMIVTEKPKAEEPKKPEEKPKADTTLAIDLRSKQIVNRMETFDISHLLSSKFSFEELYELYILGDYLSYEKIHEPIYVELNQRVFSKEELIRFMESVPYTNSRFVSLICAKYANSKEKILSIPQFFTLETGYLINILKSDNLEFTEIEIFNALIKRFDRHAKEQSKSLGYFVNESVDGERLIDCVRFENMKIEEFNTIKHHLSKEEQKEWIDILNKTTARKSRSIRNFPMFAIVKQSEKKADVYWRIPMNNPSIVRSLALVGSDAFHVTDPLLGTKHPLFNNRTMSLGIGHWSTNVDRVYIELRVNNQPFSNPARTDLDYHYKFIIGDLEYDSRKRNLSKNIIFGESLASSEAAVYYTPAQLKANIKDGHINFRCEIELKN